MKTRDLIIMTAIGISISFSLLSCSMDPNKRANELYVEASQIIQSLNTSEDGYLKTYESYKKAKQKIELIISKYASSNIAVSLMSNQAKISGLTLKEFRKTETSLSSLAETEQSPLACAVIIASTIENADGKARALANIAAKYAEAGQKEQSAQILSQARETARRLSENSRGLVKKQCIYE